MAAVPGKVPGHMEEKKPIGGSSDGTQVCSPES